MRIATLGKKIAISLQAMTLLFGLGTASVAGVVVSAAPAYAGTTACTTDPLSSADPLGAGASCSKGGSQKADLFGPTGIFTIAANTLIFLVGAISVIYLIIGGLRYVVSSGDSKAVTAAKDTILYAIIGIVVAVVSFALVQFVVNALNTAK